MRDVSPPSSLGFAADALLSIGRLLIGALFIPAGISTLSNIGGSTDYFSGLGVPLPALAALGTGLFELAAGLLIVAGWQTKLAALALACFCVATAFIGHHGQGGDDPVLRFMHEQAFAKDIAIAGGLLFLAAIGAGGYSLDARGT